MAEKPKKMVKCWDCKLQYDINTNNECPHCFAPLEEPEDDDTDA